MRYSLTTTLSITLSWLRILFILGTVLLYVYDTDVDPRCVWTDENCLTSNTVISRKRESTQPPSSVKVNSLSAHLPRQESWWIQSLNFSLKLQCVNSTIIRQTSQIVCTVSNDSWPSGDSTCISANPKPG